MNKLSRTAIHMVNMAIKRNSMDVLLTLVVLYIHQIRCFDLINLSRMCCHACDVHCWCLLSFFEFSRLLSLLHVRCTHVTNGALRSCAREHNVKRWG